MKTFAVTLNYSWIIEQVKYETIISIFSRLVQFLNGNGNIAIGGNVNPNEKYISPTILIDVKQTDPIMQEEIFGPILPIINVNDANEAIKFIKNR